MILLAFQNLCFADNNVLVVFANKQATDITQTHAQNFYSLKQKMLPNNKRVELTSYTMNDEATRRFAHSMFGYYPYQLQRLWDQAAFSGRAKRPKHFDQAQGLKNYIKENESALAYLLVQQSEVSQLQEDYHVVAIFR